MASATSGKRVDFARATVEVSAWWNTETVEIVISTTDRDRAGYAKADRRAYLSRGAMATKPKASTTASVSGCLSPVPWLERTGAKVSFTNRHFPDHGAVVKSPGRAAASRPTIYQRNQRLRVALGCRDNP